MSNLMISPNGPGQWGHEFWVRLDFQNSLNNCGFCTYATSP